MAYFVLKSLSGSNDILVSGQVFYQNQTLPAVSVSINGESVVTDENGKYSLANLDFGRNVVKFSKQGYQPKEQSVFLWKKKQEIGKIDLIKDENFSASFSGIVINNFDQKAVSGAIISLGQSNTVSGDNGEFKFSDLAKGTSVLKISAIGFIDLQEDISIGESDNNGKEYALTPYGKITFTSDREGKKNIYAINYDGKNLRNLTAGIKGDSWGGEYSTDGNRLVFFSDFEENLDLWGQKISSLYVLNKNSDKPIKISRDLIVDDGFKISRDGKRIVFIGRDKENGKSEIYVASIDGKNDWIQLTDNDTTESNIDISADGNWVVYGISNKGGEREAYLKNVISNEEIKIFTSNEREDFISFSPDGKSILYTKEGMDFSTRIFIYDIKSAKENNIYKTSSNIKNVVWGNDSKKIAFTSTRDDRTYIYTLDIDGQNEIKLSEESANYKNLVWPDLQKILIFEIQKDDGNVLGIMDVSSRKITEFEKIGDDVLSWDPQVF